MFIPLPYRILILVFIVGGAFGYGFRKGNERAEVEINKYANQVVQNLKNEMARQHEKENSKIDDLNKWRWLVMGGAGVLGWIFAKVFGFK